MDHVFRRRWDALRLVNHQGLLGLILWLCAAWPAWGYGTVPKDGNAPTLVYGCRIGAHWATTWSASIAAACSNAAAVATANTPPNTFYCGRTGNNVTSRQVFTFQGVRGSASGTAGVADISVAVSNACDGDSTFITDGFWNTDTQNMAQCPSSAVERGGECWCAKGMRPKSGASGCEAYTCFEAGAYNQIVERDILVTTRDTAVCQNGCQVVARTVNQGEDGRLWATWPFTSKGSAAYCGQPPPSESTPTYVPKVEDKTGKSYPNSPPSPCESGTCPGSINGNQTCQPCKATTTSKDVLTGQSGESTTGRTVTTCVGTACTTTTYNPDGTPQSITIGPPGTTGGVSIAGTGSGVEGASSAASGAGNGTGTGGGGGDYGDPAELPEKLYVKKDKTFKQAVESFATGFKQTAIGQATGGFFQVSVGGGTCPTWTMQIDYLNGSAQIDFLCSQGAQLVLQAIGGVMLVIAAFAAFRVAFL